MLAKAVQEITDAEAARLKITWQNATRLITLEDAPRGTKSAALAGFENLLRTASVYPFLAEKCIESVEGHTALFSWEDGGARRVIVKSGLLCFQLLDAEGKPLTGAEQELLPADAAEGMGAVRALSGRFTLRTLETSETGSAIKSR